MIQIELLVRTGDCNEAQKPWIINSFFLNPIDSIQFNQFVSFNLTNNIFMLY